MKKVNSQSDVITDWEQLIEAVQSDPSVQPSVDANRQSLAQSLTQMQALKARQNELRGLRQEVTQQLAATVEQGRETASKIRSVVKGTIGPKSERLVHFNIVPSGKRKRKKKDPTGGAPEPNPVPAATPSGKTAD
jgi:hypothetical protein